MSSSARIRSLVRDKKSPTKKVVNKKTVLTRAKAKTVSVTQKKSRSAPKKKAVASSRSKPVKKKINPITSVTRSLMVLSPFRFPLDVDRIAVQSARYGGVFFVFLGAIFSLFYADQTFNAVNVSLQNASTITTSFDSNLYNDSNTLVTSSEDTTQRYVSSSQDFSFHPEAPIKGNNVRVRLEPVGYPHSATLRAKESSSQTVYNFGNLASRSEDDWELYIDSSTMRDGKYRFQVIATYKDHTGSYYSITISDTEDRMVQNVSDITSVITGTVDNTVDDITQNIEPVTEDVKSSIEIAGGSVIVGRKRISVFTTKADSVKLSLTSQETSRTTTLGYAYRYSDTEWRYQLDSTVHADGEYYLQASVVNEGSLIDSTRIAVTIENLTTKEVYDEDQQTLEAEVPSQTTIEEYTNPVIDVFVLGSSPITGRASTNVNVDGANYVELYVLPKNSATQRYLGLPKKVDKALWNYTWDTTAIPNGEYRLIAKVRTDYGIFVGQSDWLKVYNELVTISEPSDLEYREKVTSLGDAAKVTTSIADQLTDANLTLDEQLNKLVSATAEPQKLTIEEEFRYLLSYYQTELEEALQILAVAYRSGDEQSIQRAKNKIDSVTSKIRGVIEQRPLSEELLKRKEETISYLTNRIESDVKRTNLLIKERIGIDAEVDSDNDGLTDFDEVFIYKTDPNVADSDGDGFTDGAEVLSGYDPTDPTPEVPVVYESPKEVGVVREDLLSVHSIITEVFNEGGETDRSAHPVAVITGKGLPNSFVTLYIFSTPIVVTVRTESDGSWVYRFDKELDDGEHQVYVGMTDNAGKIIAKSNPLSFIKQAQAYTQVDTPAPGATIVQHSDSGSDELNPAMLLVASISVVAIGLVLMLLGWHLEARPRLRFSELSEKTVS